MKNNKYNKKYPEINNIKLERDVSMVIHDLSLIQVHSQVHASNNRESNTLYINYFIQKYSSPQYIHGLVQGCSTAVLH